MSERTIDNMTKRKHIDCQRSNIKYKMVKCETDFDFRTYKFKQSYTFEELKAGIADAFYKGVKWVRLYSDCRKVNSFLQIKKDDFDPLFIENSYIRIQTERQINQKLKNIEMLNSTIHYNQKRVSEIMLEINTLKGIN